MRPNLFFRISAITFFLMLCSFGVFAQLDYYPSHFDTIPYPKGKFKPTDQSLKQYKYPKWFRDAKFGIWAHWGPQSVPRQGDWYARNMYIQQGNTWETADYNDHLKRYGHPSIAGYKNIIPLWKAQKWDPAKLMALYKKAGAKYFVSMGVHHDDFFLWNSKLHKWNAVNNGPHKDVVGTWQKEAKKQGLHFGVSEHLGASYTWFQAAHSADTLGSMKGIPYDGNDPKYSDLYHRKAAPNDHGWLTNNTEWQHEWYYTIQELINKYHPDLLYSDSALPFGNIGRSLIAHFYNDNRAQYKGELEAVYTCKEPSQGRFVQDVERGVMDTLSQYPWQTDTSIGDWFYRSGQKYKSATDIIQMLVDIVSKNGNLLINVVQTPEGDLEPDMLHILNGIATWTAANGEGIYASRPWKVYGENPANAKVVKTSMFNEGKLTYNAQNIRFTTKGKTLYAFCLGKPTNNIRILSLRKNNPYEKKTITNITLLGNKEHLNWHQEDDALVIDKPAILPDWEVLGFKITLKK